MIGAAESLDGWEWTEVLIWINRSETMGDSFAGWALLLAISARGFDGVMAGAQAGPLYLE